MPGLLLIVGEVMLDVLGPPAGEGSAHAPVLVRPGGTAVTVALAARAEGMRTALAARVGDDVSGAAIRSTLEAAGVETYLAVDPELPTGAFVELGGSIVAARGANAALSPADVPVLNADAVFVSGYVLAHDDTVAAGREALACKARLRAVAATPFASRDFVERAVDANVLFANDGEAERLGPIDDLLSQFEILCITHGPTGATLYRDAKSEHLPPTGVTGTGAGDAFAGTVLARL